MLTDTNVAAINAAVAEHVRALRLTRGWSLDELSARSKVSKGMVVQIEGARTNPSIGTLCRLAEAFGVTVTRLLEPAAERTVRITDAAAAPSLWQGGYGGFSRLLAGVNDPALVELWEWQLSPRDTHSSPEHTPGTREMLHVLDGVVIVTVDGADHTVHAGQTMEFRADRAHGYRNEGNTATRLLMVVVIPPGGWAGAAG